MGESGGAPEDAGFRALFPRRERMRFRVVRGEMGSDGSLTLECQNDMSGAPTWVRLDAAWAASEPMPGDVFHALPLPFVGGLIAWQSS